MKIKRNSGVNFWCLIIYIFAFERTLTGLWSGFSYIDELFMIATAGLIFIKTVRQSLLLKRTEVIILICLMLLCLIGIVSNLSANIFTDKVPIVIDIISTTKVWLAYYAILTIHQSGIFFDNLIKKMASWGRMLTIVMFLCLIVSMVVNIGMTGSERYGFASFQFVFNNPGNFSKLFYFLIPLLTADLMSSNTRYKKCMIGIALLVWLSTMRSRAFAFVAVYLIMAFLFFSTNGKRLGLMIRNRIKIVYLIPVALLAVTICWNQLIFYFTTATQARAILLRYGLKTMINYFPLGSGFGTFGSDIAFTHYSKLYMQYGFNSIYGMREGEGYYLNDNYWPMIMGQFGILGLILVFYILLIFMKMVLQETQRNRYLYFAAFCALGFLALSSIASKSYSEYSSICVFLLLGVFVQRERKMSKII